MRGKELPVANQTLGDITVGSLAAAVVVVALIAERSPGMPALG